MGGRQKGGRHPPPEWAQVPGGAAYRAEGALGPQRQLGSLVSERIIQPHLPPQHTHIPGLLIFYLYVSCLRVAPDCREVCLPGYK